MANRRTLAGVAVAVLMSVFLIGCASMPADYSEHLAEAPRGKVENQFYRCDPGSAVPRFTPSGDVPEHRQVPRGGNCLRGGIR
jgi:hypothetical protein